MGWADVAKQYYSTLGTLAVRYTSPDNGEQLVAQIRIINQKPKIVFTSPTDFLFNSDFKSLQSVRKKIYLFNLTFMKGGIFVHNYITLRIESGGINPTAIKTLHTYLSGLQAQLDSGKVIVNECPIYRYALLII